MRKAMIFVWIVILGGAAFIQFLNQSADVLENATQLTAEEMGVGTTSDTTNTTTDTHDPEPANDAEIETGYTGYAYTKGCALLDDYLTIRGTGAPDEDETARDLRGFGMRTHGISRNGEDRDTFGKALRDVAQATGAEYDKALNTAQEFCTD